jgi:hypothetical protein
MTSFTTRVELHKASSDDYDTLHEAMESRGFKRKIKSDTGVWYHLPEAEYDLSADITRGDVLDKAKAAVDSTGKKGMILVTESAGRTWNGLAKVG